MSEALLPLPVAVLRRRSVNAKSAKDLHDTAYFAWEVSLRLAVAAEPPADPSPLVRASLGLWVAALTRPSTRIHDPELLDVFRLLTEEGEGKAGRPSHASPRTLLAALPAYRNRVVGHGSVRLRGFYARAGAILQRGLGAAWRAGLFLDPRDRICRVEAPAPGDAGEPPLLRSLMGEASERMTGELTDLRGDLRPGRLYLTGPAGWRALYPWLLSLDAEGRERVLCLDAVGRKDARYLDYATGELARGDDLRARYPHILGDLHAVFGDASAAYAAPPTESAADPNDLGGFRILGKLGEGGMGIVYLARQASLGRLAAVKMLPRELAEDDTAVARFQREITALSRCEHPNVVKILTSGTARGLHFYAMEYVEGADLARIAGAMADSRGDFDLALSSASARVRAANADVFADAPVVPPRAVPIPAPGDRCRRIVTLIRDAARGLHHLHEQGIVHRDIKPANIAVTEHGQRAVIMDLGLVALSDASRSLTRDQGHVVGTLRYVAPERLRGRVDQIDRRTDIYSLGATLSELLTDKPFFDGDSVERLIQQILAERPALPERARAAIPRDVITIVTKATEKDPAQRYATARDLAKDLDAYLEARPIAARTPTPGYVVGLAIRRHLAFSISIAAALLLAIGGIVLFIDHQRQARETESRLRVQAEAEFGRAEELSSFMLGDLRTRLIPLGRLDLLESIARKAKAHYEQLPAERQTPRALTMRSNALDHVGRVLGELGDNAAALDAYLASLRLSEQVLATQPTDLEARLNVLKSKHRIGMAQEALGRSADAGRTYEAALQALDALRAAHPAPLELDRLRASLLRGVGDVCQAEGDLPGAVDALRSGLEIARRLREIDPDDARHVRWVASFANDVADILEAQSKTAEALALLRESLDARSQVVRASPDDYPAKRDLAVVHVRLAQMLTDADAKAAHEHVDAAIELGTQLVARDPENAQWKRLLASGYEVRGALLRTEARYEPAFIAYERGLTLRTELAATHPEHLDWQRDIAGMHHELAMLYKSRGAVEQALASFRKSLAVIEPLAKAHPQTADWQYGVYVNNAGLADLLATEGRLDEAQPHQQAALEIIGRLVALAPTAVPWQMELASTHTTGGSIQARRGEHLKALEAYQHAVERLDPLATKEGPPFASRLLAHVHSQIGLSFRKLDRHDDAARAFQRALDLVRRLPPLPDDPNVERRYERWLEDARAAK